MEHEIQADWLLFDLDGTLIDSTEAVVRHWTVFGQENGIEPALILATSHGRRSIDVLQEHAPQLANAEACRRMEAELPRLYADKATALPGAVALLQQLHAQRDDGWAIVTSGTRGLAEGWLRIMKLPFPRVFITADDVAQGKPDPEGYRKARELLRGRDTTGRTATGRTVVFEDAPSGCMAGKAAGATVVGVLTTHSREQLLAAGADYLVADLAHVALDLADGIKLHLSQHLSQA